MDDIENLVRMTLTDRAAGVGAPTDLVRRARRRARQGRRRAQAVGVAVAAAAVLLAVPAATRVWAPAPPSTVDVAAAPTLELPPFPFTPTVSLPGYGEPIAEISAGAPGLRYAGDADRGLTVSVTAERPPPLRWERPPKRYGVTVHQREAALEVATAGYALTWQEPDGRWVRVEADPHLTREALVRYAAGLTPGAVPVRSPFTFDAVPPGTVPDVVTRAAVSFRPVESPPSHGFAGNLTVTLSWAAEVPPTGRPVPVGARTGRLDTGAEATTLSVDLGDGRTLVVQSWATMGLSEAELGAFAAGVRPTPDAEVAQG